MTGSWAGAMGHTQFIPTSYLAYAVDIDGNGQRDIWNSVPDALATAANLLAQERLADRQDLGLRGRPCRAAASFPAARSRIANGSARRRRASGKRFRGRPTRRNSSARMDAAARLS